MELIALFLLYILSALGSLYEVVVFNEKNETRNPLILEFSRDPKKILLLFQLLVTVSNLGIGALSEAIIQDASPWIRTFYFSAVTVTVILFSELLPKQLGFFYSKFFLQHGGEIVLLFFKVLNPILTTLSNILTKISKILKIETKNLTPSAELEQLRAELEELISSKPEKFTKKALAILQSLSVARVSDVLIPRTKLKLYEFENIQNATSSLKQIDKDWDRVIVKVREKFYSLDPRYESDGQKFVLVEAITCSSLDSALEILVELNNSKAKLAICLDEFGMLDGVFDPKKIVDAMYSWSQAFSLSESKIIVTGSTRLIFIALFFNQDKLSNFDLSRTVDSVLIELLGHSLQPGSQIKIGQLHFRVIKTDGKKADLVEVEFRSGK